MEDILEAASKTVAVSETELLTSVTLRDLTPKGLDEQLAKFRDACVNLIFLDFHSAALKSVETRLWDAHVRINSKFRPILAQFREADGKKKHVERRKAEKLYLDFIKTSMRFYRGFVQRLASHFEDVPEVFAIATKFSLDTLSADAPVAVDLEQKRLIIRSCYTTLIHLGDLSRYRETELNQKERNWGPAKGYYDLAIALDPTDGQSWNQLAVVSLADNDHLRAIYYLYRSLSTQKPPPLTLKNLETAFKKMIRQYERGELLVSADTSGVPITLASAFLSYHARCHTDSRFDDPEEEEIRKALLVEFKTTLATEPFDPAYRKMCLINIAASKYAEVHVQEIAHADPKAALKFSRIFRRAQAMNIGMFTMLFKLLADECRDGNPKEGSLSPLIRRILPLLRLYSAWLLSNVQRLLEVPKTVEHSWNLDDLWISYTDALSEVIAQFDVLGFPQASYLFSEDQETLAFTPFSDPVNKLHLKGSAGSMKPSRADCNSSEVLSAEQEMQSRLRALVQVGAHLYQSDEFGEVPVPIRYGGQRFHFVSSGPSVNEEYTESSSEVHLGHSEMSSLQAGELMPSAAENMVDDLVGPSHGTVSLPKSSRPQSQSPGVKPTSRPASLDYSVQHLVRQIQQPSLSNSQPLSAHSPHQTSLPGIWQTPFTPRPDEQLGSGLSSRPGTAHRHNSPSTAPVPPSSGALDVQQQIAQLQHNIEARTSPIIPVELTQSSYYKTPSGLYTFLRNQPDQSPWENSLTTSSAPSIGTELPKKTSTASPFGAIGERPKTAKTPTSGQPG